MQNFLSKLQHNHSTLVVHHLIFVSNRVEFVGENVCSHEEQSIPTLSFKTSILIRNSKFLPFGNSCIQYPVFSNTDVTLRNILAKKLSHCCGCKDTGGILGKCAKSRVEKIAV